MGDGDRLYGVESPHSECPYSALHGRAAGMATGRAKTAGEAHPSVIGASQATARSVSRSVSAPPCRTQGPSTLLSIHSRLKVLYPIGGGRTP